MRSLTTPTVAKVVNRRFYPNKSSIAGQCSEAFTKSYGEDMAFRAKDSTAADFHSIPLEDNMAHCAGG